MHHQWNRHCHKYPLSATCVLVLHQTAVFLLLTHCGGQAEMIGSSAPILAMIGEEVILPCHLQPATDVSPSTLEWARLDLNPRFVHVRRDSVELLVNQNPSYMGRTSLSDEKLEHGDMSLTLSKVKLSDQGKYRCHIPAQGTSTVDLVVGAVSSPVIIIKEIDKEMVFQCESKGWFPEPEVLWINSEGNRLSAGPTDTLRGPDGLFTVSSRLSVEKRNSISLTCRVQQKNINQTRETGIQIQGDVCVAQSGPATGIIVVLVVGFLCLFVVFFVLWRLRQYRGDRKMYRDKVTQKEREEEELLVKGSTTTKDVDHEMLQEKEEEKNDMQHVISIVEEQKKELERTRSVFTSKLENVEKEWRENEKKLQKENSLFSWNKDVTKSSLLELKIELENERTKYKTSQDNTEQKLQKFTDVIFKMENLKKKVENQIDEIKKALNKTSMQQVEEDRGENKTQLKEIKSSSDWNKPNETKQERVEKEGGEKKTKIQKVMDMLPWKKSNETSHLLESNIDLENEETEHGKTSERMEKKEQKTTDVISIPEEQKTEPESSRVEQKSKQEMEEVERGEKKIKLDGVKDSFQENKPNETNPLLKSEIKPENQETELKKSLDGTGINKQETMVIISVPEEQKTEPESSKGQKSKQKKVEEKKGEKKTKLQKVRDRLSWNKLDKTNRHLESKTEQDDKKTEGQEELQSEQTERGDITTN